MSMDWAELRRQFRAKHFRSTRQREKIFQVFLSFPQKHLSAGEVYSLLSPDERSIGLVTVYRTLGVLEKLGFLRCAELDAGKKRFELSSEGAGHSHHQLICLSCGSITEFKTDLMETLETCIHRTLGFEIVNHQVKFYGFCYKCKK